MKRAKRQNAVKVVKRKKRHKHRGRPTSYSDKIATEICVWLSSGNSLTSYCAQEGKPHYTTIMHWLCKDRPYRDEFVKRYEKAREQQADCLSDQLLDISDDGTNDYMEKLDKDGGVYYKLDKEHVQRSRLRVDTRKWIASKLKPRKYGDTTNLKLSDENGGPIIFKVVYEEQKEQPKED